MTAQFFTWSYMTHILGYMPVWCFWQTFFPIGFFDFADKHKTEIAIVKDYKDKCCISWFILFVFYVTDIAKFAYRNIYPKKVWITACVKVSARKKSSCSLKTAQVCLISFNVQVREYERKHINWRLIGQKLCYLQIRTDSKNHQHLKRRKTDFFNSLICGLLAWCKTVL